MTNMSNSHKISDLKEEQTLAEAMAWLEEQEQERKDVPTSQVNDSVATADPTAAAPYDELIDTSILNQIDKRDSELPTLQLQYSFSSLTDDVREESYCKRIHVDIIRNENLGYYGNINKRPSEVIKVGQLEIEILDWQRAAEFNDVWVTAGLARDNSIVETFINNDGTIKERWKQEFEKCQSKNILYIHSMELIGTFRHHGLGAYVLKSIFDTFHDMFGIMVLDPWPVHYQYLKGDYREPGYDYSRKLSAVDIAEDRDHAALNLIFYYETLGFHCTESPIRPYGVYSLMYLNANTPSPLRDLDIYVFWDY